MILRNPQMRAVMHAWRAGQPGAEGGESPTTLDVPPPLRRTAQPDHDAWLASAVLLLDLVARSFGRADLSTASLLDVGCGTKFTKVILERDIPDRTLRRRRHLG